MVWKLSRPERDSNPRYPAWKSSALTTRPPSLTEGVFLDLHILISNGFVSSKIFDKRDDFDFDIVNFPFLDGDVPRVPSYGVYIFQLILFAKMSSYFADIDTRNNTLTAKLLQQVYRYHKLRKSFF